MPVVPFTTQGARPSVITDPSLFNPNGHAILIKGIDESQLVPTSTDCNITYDLRVGNFYRDHRNLEGRTLQQNGSIELLPGNAIIIQTAEEVHFPNWVFGQIVPKVSLLQTGLSNTPGKIDPGYTGRLLVTIFNHGKRAAKLHSGQRLCSMFISTVEGEILPYNKPSQHIKGVPHKYPWLRFRDLLEANIGSVTAVLLIITALNTLALLFQ